jgi:predicted Zn-dependent peptidase
MNGTTSADRTNYFESLPANQLELGLFLESDRMRSLAVTQANFDNQRKAVQEERRLNYDNQPYGRTYEILLETAYDNFAYKHSTIGDMKDLDAATIEEARAFYAAYYAPDNAVLALVGDFDPRHALERIRHYFEAIPARPAPPAPDMAEPEQKGERRRVVEDAFAQAARIDIAYKIPPASEPDWIPLSVLGDVLADGDSSRLVQALVKQKAMAVSVSGGAHERRGPGLAQFTVTVRPGQDLAAAEREALALIEGAADSGAEPWELEKVRLQFRRQMAEHLQETLRRAVRLAQDAVFYGDPLHVNTLEPRIAAVTSDDVRRVAKRYLTRDNRTVVLTVPSTNPPGQAK